MQGLEGATHPLAEGRGNPIGVLSEELKEPVWVCGGFVGAMRAMSKGVGALVVVEEDTVCCQCCHSYPYRPSLLGPNTLGSLQPTAAISIQ